VFFVWIHAMPAGLLEAVESPPVMCWSKVENIQKPLGSKEQTDRKRRKIMTDKAKMVLNDLDRRDRKGGKRWTPYGLNDAKTRNLVLGELNASTMDDVGPVGGDQGMTVLKDMNDIESEHDTSFDELKIRRV